MVWENTQKLGLNCFFCQTSQTQLEYQKIQKIKKKQDIVNEPDSRGIRWSSGPNGQGPGMQELYIEAMDAIAEVRGVFFSSSSGGHDEKKKPFLP